MIFVDSRVGSIELHELIEDSIPVTLEFGDACFMGNGPEGNVEIGIERKRIGDLVNSIATGRLSGHQLPGLLEKYHRVYLIVEGIWRKSDTTEEIEIRKCGRWKTMNQGKRKFTYQGIWAYLNTLEIITGIVVRTTADIRNTAMVIEWAYDWWQKDWNKHRAHLQLHKQTPQTIYLRPGKPSLMKRMASELPGVGFERATNVEKLFPTIEDLVMAKEEELREIEGIGKITAQQIYKAIHLGE